MEPTPAFDLTPPLEIPRLPDDAEVRNAVQRAEERVAEAYRRREEMEAEETEVHHSLVGEVIVKVVENGYGEEKIYLSSGSVLTAGCDYDGTTWFEVDA